MDASSTRARSCTAWIDAIKESSLSPAAFRAGIGAGPSSMEISGAGQRDDGIVTVYDMNTRENLKFYNEDSARDEESEDGRSQQGCLC